MVSMFTSSVGSSLGKTKDYKIVICYFFTKNSALKSKNKDWLWLNNNKMNCELMLLMIPPLFSKQEVGMTGQKTLPTIWGTYMKLVTKYQISAINRC